MTTAILLLVAILVAVFALVASVESEIDDLNRGSGGSSNTGTTTPPAGGSGTTTPDGSETTTPGTDVDLDAAFEGNLFTYASNGSLDGSIDALNYAPGFVGPVVPTVKEFVTVTDLGIMLNDKTPGIYTLGKIGQIDYPNSDFCFYYRPWLKDGESEVLDDELHYIDQTDLVIYLWNKDKGEWLNGGSAEYGYAGLFFKGNYDTSYVMFGIAEGASIPFDCFRLYCLVG